MHRPASQHLYAIAADLERQALTLRGLWGETSHTDQPFSTDESGDLVTQVRILEQVTSALLSLGDRMREREQQA